MLPTAWLHRILLFEVEFLAEHPPCRLSLIIVNSSSPREIDSDQAKAI